MSHPEETRMDRKDAAVMMGGAAAASVVAVRTLQRFKHKLQQEPVQVSKEGSLVTRNISLDQATRVVDGAVRRAGELGIRQDVAVVDAGGNLKSFVRMDGAWLGSIDIAIRKARTARLFDTTTASLGKLAQPGESLYGIEQSNDGLIVFGGGAPIKDNDGVIIGAIGVSGSTVDDDIEVAEAGIASLNA
jgi:uncharacterized protein GlcG (DUF336 family)